MSAPGFGRPIWLVQLSLLEAPAVVRLRTPRPPISHSQSIFFFHISFSFARPFLSSALRLVTLFALGSTLLLLRIIIGRRRSVVISGSGRSLRWVFRLRLGRRVFRLLSGGRPRPPGWLADSGCSVVSVHLAVLGPRTWSWTLPKETPSCTSSEEL